MRICRFTGEEFPPLEKINNGLAPNYYYLSKELEKLGVKTILIAGGYPKYEKYEKISEGIEVYRIRTKSPLLNSFFYFPICIQALKILKKIKYDVLNIHNFYGYWLTYLIKKPIVLSLHGCDVELARELEYLPFWKYPLINLKDRFSLKKTIFLYNLSLKKIDNIVNVCAAENIDIKKRNPRCEITVIPNGTDFDLFKKSTLDKLKEKYGTNFIIFTISRSSPVKGLRYLLHAIQLLKKYNIKLFVAGKLEPKYKQYTCNLISKLRIEKRVELLGSLNFIDLPNYYSISDLFVNPSLTEGIPKAVIESLACKCPVLATNAGGTSEIIKNRNTGLLVSKKDPIALANKIEYAINHPSEMRQLALKGHKFVKSNFNWKLAAMKYFNLYDRLI